MTLALKVLSAFLIGSIPFAKIAMLGTGIDITKVGSRNPGFNNVLRVSSKWRAAIALIGDIAKGSLAVWLFGPHWLVVIAPVVGHCWSPWLRFNGGKGGRPHGRRDDVQAAMVAAGVPATLSGTSIHWKKTRMAPGRRDRVHEHDAAACDRGPAGVCLCHVRDCDHPPYPEFA